MASADFMKRRARSACASARAPSDGRSAGLTIAPSPPSCCTCENDVTVFVEAIGRQRLSEWFLFLPQVRLSVDDIVERARVAEDSGFDGIAFIDHLEAPGATHQSIWEAM